MTSTLFSLPTNPLPERLQEYRLKGKFTDFTIKVGDEKFAAHKIVLEDSSPVLKALLSENWIKDDVCEFNERFVDSNIVEDLLGFFYTSKLLLTLDNAFSICVASHFLNIPVLVSASEQFLSDHINFENVTELFLLSDNLNLDTLQEKCIDYVSVHHEVVLKDKKIDNFTLEKLKKLILELNGKSSDPKIKESLYWMIISWTEYKLDDRLSFLPSLLRSIPLFDLSIKFLSEVVTVQSVICETKTCSALLMDAFNKSFRDSQEFTTTNSVFCFGGLDINDAISSASQWNIFNGKSNILTSMSGPRSKFAGVRMGGKIYLIGGRSSKHDEVRLETMEVYDCSSNTFTKLQSMPEARSSCSALVFKGNIYVSGGTTSTGERLSSVLQYNIQTGEWSEVKSMIEKRTCHKLVKLEGCFYAICGEASNTVEKYNPINEKWTMIANTNFKHYFFDATVHEGKIYVCSHLGFEVYSPYWNSWKVLTFLDNRWGKTLVSMNGKLWALGGGVTSADMKSVFSYDTFTEKWQKEPDMEIGRSYHCSVVIRE